MLHHNFPHHRLHLRGRLHHLRPLSARQTPVVCHPSRADRPPTAILRSSIFPLPAEFSPCRHSPPQPAYPHHPKSGQFSADKPDKITLTESDNSLTNQEQVLESTLSNNKKETHRRPINTHKPKLQHHPVHIRFLTVIIAHPPAPGRSASLRSARAPELALARIERPPHVRN